MIEYPRTVSVTPMLISPNLLIDVVLRKPETSEILMLNNVHRDRDKYKICISNISIMTGTGMSDSDE